MTELKSIFLFWFTTMTMLIFAWAMSRTAWNFQAFEVDPIIFILCLILFTLGSIKSTLEQIRYKR